MSTLFTQVMMRNPKTAPPLPPDRAVIVTHPVGADGTTKVPAFPLHDQLRAAWQASNWTLLAQIARGHLEEAKNEPAKLHAFSEAAIAFLKPNDTAATDDDFGRFVDEFDAAALKAYFADTQPRDCADLADEALALHCVGMLGTASSDPIGKLRSLNAFSALVAGRAGDRRKGGISPKLLVERAWGAEVHLPPWSFEIDACGDLHIVSKPTVPLTPLELKLQRLQQMRDGATGECDCEPPAPVCTPQSVCCPEFKYFLGELLELRTWTQRYKAGDLAYIEVVGAGETFVREHTLVRTKDVFTDLETSLTTMEKRDLSVTDTGTLTREIDRVNSSKLDGTAAVTGSYGTEKSPYKFSATATLSYGKSASETLKQTQAEARTVVSTAVSQIDKKVRSQRNERVTSNETDKNVHTWGNASGDDPKVTKYFYVNQEKRAQLYSHGVRMLAELIIPSPGRLYERLMADRLEAEIRRRVAALTLTAPLAPAGLDFAASSLTRENYLEKTGLYGVSSPPLPPAAATSVAASQGYSGVKNKVANLGVLALSVPTGYHAVHVTLSGGAGFRDTMWGTGKGRFIRFTLVNVVWFAGDNGHSLDASLPNLTGQLSFAVTAANITGCNATLTVTCGLDTAAFAAWQVEVFKLIKEAYDTRLAAYEKALAEFQDAKAEHDAAEAALRVELQDGEASRNPFYNRQMEQTELKRAAIYLLCEDFSAAGAWIRKAEPCGLPEIDRHEAEMSGYDWYFWDRVFDWKYMAYAFFDYFWNPMCDWSERFDPDHPDPLFKAFLGAGYARVLIPISPSMELDFLWYAASLQKWGQTGEPPLDPTDSRWRNVLFELKYANENAMMPRQGHVANVATGDVTILIKETDRYWDSSASIVDAAAVASDVDREMFIDGSAYLVADIQQDPGSPVYSNAETMWWRVTLDRPYEGSSSARRLFAFGAQAVAPSFSFDMPTELVWASAHDACLPTYPLPPCG